MSIEPRRLLVLRAVHRAGGVLPAARALHLSPSAVSQHVARLERETGLVLLDRTQRGGGRVARLTQQGIALAHRADSVAAALADAERAAQEMSHHHKGIVRIGGFASALTHIAVHGLADLAVHEPCVAPAMVEIADQQGRADLRGGRLDLLVSWYDDDAPDQVADLVVHPLLDDAYRVAIPEAWQTRTPDELLAGPWITAPPGDCAYRVLNRLAARTGTVLDRPHECTDSRTMLAFVAAGLGAAVVPNLTLTYLPTEGITTVPPPVDLGYRVITLLSTEDADGPTAAVHRHLCHQAGR